jgi:hypothetical protein
MEFKNLLEGNKLHCMDESLELWGDFNTANAKLLFLSFDKCDPTVRTTCKNETEVKEWLKKKYLVIVYNKNTFVTDEFKERTL